MRFARPATAIAAACVVFVGVSAQAGTAPKKPLSWTDQAGDANGSDFVMTGIVSGLPAPLDKGFAGPGSSAGRDLVKVELANTWVKKAGTLSCNGFTVTETFSAPPTTGDTIYRLSSDTDNNPAFVLFQYDTADGTTSIRYGVTAQTDEDTIATHLPAKVVGNKLIWTIDRKDIKNINEAPGSVLKDLYGEISGDIKGAVFLPVYDQAPTADTFSICK